MATLTRDDTRTTREIWAAISSGSDGTTVDALDGQLPCYGYWVGGRSWTLVRAASKITPDDVAGFVSSNSDCRYFGMWLDSGRVYLDAVDLIYSATDAREAASDRCELSIFDISSGECQEV